ncbi:unnamed protein product [Rhizoctonia solani]|uniref:Uncharacterized protein n=1 Tax=Rhizoctonia solani TaxID=456999 RepID=A0A8H3AL01_9AGAM|nr:unnamed protein product [Rhizoctonia solani]
MANRPEEYERLGDKQSGEISRFSHQTLCKHRGNIITCFPPEIWFEIIFHAVCLSTNYKPGNAAEHNECKVEATLLWNLGSVSKFHRQLVLRYWAHTIYLREQVDLEKFKDLGTAHGIDLMSYMRCLVCKDEYDVYRAPEYAFKGFGLIEELVLNCHWDINFGGRQPGHLTGHAEAQVAGTHGDQPAVQENLDADAHPQPARMSYRRLKINLPGTLRILRVYGSHVPDIYFIKQVAEQCPLLQSLTLARCTLFNHQGCEFWERLPRTESDAYFSDQGVSAYATAVGRELKHIKNLRELQIGIYLTNHTAIDTHLQQHAGLSQTSETGLEVWEKSCEKCVAQYQEPTVATEIEATEMLAKEVSTLLSVSWASFCSEKRIGWSTHQIMRNEGGEFRGFI